MIGQKKSTILEWVILLGLTACAIAAAEMIELSQLWKDGVVYTVVVFAVVLIGLRPAWERKSFWTSLALIFVGHAIVLLAVLQAMPPRRFGIPKLLLVPLGGIESVFITGILWKRMKALRTSGPQS
jgi:asparagine N-glycosylation enzyme membrane subunit Stt3